MGDSRVEMSADKTYEGKTRRAEESGWGTAIVVVSILVGAIALAASVYYPTIALLKEIQRLVSHIENSTTASNGNSPMAHLDSHFLHPKTLRLALLLDSVTTSFRLNSYLRVCLLGCYTAGGCNMRFEARTFCTNNMSNKWKIYQWISGLPRDCYDIQQFGHLTSGIYKIYPGDIKRGVHVLCDMDTDDGGWLVFQKRFDGSVDFFNSMMDYQFGFGNLSSEFWLGNEFIHSITNQGPYELRIDMSDFEENVRFAKYKLFHVKGRDFKFRLSVGGYTGNAGDSLSHHNGMAFSAKDADNDMAGGNCAMSFKGGFWYENCHHANPNGQYLSGAHETLAIGVNWQTWKGYKYSLKTIDMKVRPL